MIDESQSQYPADDVIQMKKVREFAQGLSLHDPDISYFASWIGPRRLDEIVWANLPDLDVEQIRAAVVREGKRCITLTPIPVPPAEFVLKPVSVATRRALPAPKPVVGGATYSRDYRRAVELISTWAESIEVDGVARRGFIRDGHVKLTARDPDTGQLLDASIWTMATVKGIHRFTYSNGEFVRLQVTTHVGPMSNLFWRLKVDVTEGICKTQSTLALVGSISPQTSYEWFERDQFDEYRKVVEKLEEGWEPVGFVSLELGDWAEPDAVHPEPFEIDLKAPIEHIEKSVRNSSKVQLGYELGDQWRMRFHFTPELFNEELTEATIRDASEWLLARRDAAPYPTRGSTEPLVMLNARYAIRLTFRDGNLMFRITPAK